MKIALHNAICVVFALVLSANTSSDDGRQSHVNFRLDATIKTIIDGDTVAIEGNNNKRFVIRLSDLDTPET